MWARCATLAAVAAAALVAGCATRKMNFALPRMDDGPEAAYNGVCHGEACKPGYDASHYQYFDEKRRRYYYFDLQKRQYFWANGEPKT